VGFVLALLIFRWPGHLPPNWGDIPNWCLVVLAAGGGWFTLSQLRVAQDALVEQKRSFTEQLRVQQRQLDEQTKAFERDTDERRRAQAKLVFLWVTVGPDQRVGQVQHNVMGTFPGLVQVVHVNNTSKQPVYDLAVDYYNGDRFHNTLNGDGWMGPDSQQDLFEALTGSVTRYRVTLSFRDAAGVRWLLDEAGNMNEVK
jgi:hypothetical protein